MVQTPLHISFDNIQPDEFNINDIPEISDFFVSITNGLEFKSKDHGLLTGFPWFDNVDIAVQYLPKEQIPGLDGEVWDEEDQGWRVVIISKDEFIIVLGTNEPHGNTINSYYKVKKEIYKNTWYEIIEKYPSVDKSLWKGWWHY